MRHAIWVVVLAAACSAPAAERRPVPTVPPELLRTDTPIEAQRVRLDAALRPEVRARLCAPTEEVLRRVTWSLGAVEPQAAATAAVSAAFVGQPGSDIEALAFLVLMNAARSAQEDLRTIMEAVKAINAAKDRMSELSDLQSLELQMAIDRLSRFESTLSNLLKKISETSESIIQNIK
jgi:hypothetical protein